VYKLFVNMDIVNNAIGENQPHIIEKCHC